ncbi:hypothetical protein AAMO2058_001417400 [Amorphochlora amoebiformis]
MSQQQRINCDFSGFPDAFIETVHLCQPGKDSRTKFRAEMILNDRTSELSFLQMHTFTSIVLKLTFCAGDEATLRKYLAEKSENFKRLCMEKERNIKHKTALLVRATEEITNLKNQVGKLSLMKEQEIKQTELKMQEKLNTSEKLALKASQNLQERLESEFRRVEVGLKEQLGSTQEAYERLSVENTELNNTVAALRVKKGNLESRMQVMEKQSEDRMSELKTLREENMKFDTQVHELQKQANVKNIQIAEFQQQVKFKESVISDLRVHAESWAQEKKRMDDQLNVYKESMEDGGSRMRDLNKRLEQQTRLNVELQRENKEQERKLSDYGEKARELKEKIESLRKDNDDTHSKLNRASADAQKQKGFISRAKKMKDLIDEVQKQKSLIEYLQKQLTKYETPFRQQSSLIRGSVYPTLDEPSEYRFETFSASPMKPLTYARTTTAFSPLESKPAYASEALSFTKRPSLSTEGLDAVKPMAEMSLRPLGEIPSPEYDLDFSRSHDAPNSTSAYFGSGKRNLAQDEYFKSAPRGTRGAKSQKVRDESPD